jgi:hypothetical protein
MIMKDIKIKSSNLMMIATIPSFMGGHRHIISFFLMDNTRLLNIPQVMRVEL